MEDNGWKVQYSLKLGPHMLNLRADDWSNLIPLIQGTAENFDLLKTTAKLFEPEPHGGFPVADIRATPPVASITPPAPTHPTTVPGEAVTTVRGVFPKTGKSGKGYTEILFDGGIKASTFDQEIHNAALIAQSQNRKVGVVFVEKGQFKNVGSLRLLGAA
jgi:hypothetical protein